MAQPETFGKKLMSILGEIESAWLPCAIESIAHQVSRIPQEKFYGAGFWGFYMDYTVFGSPCFAMNTESYFLKTKADGVHRWYLPDWQFDVLREETKAMTALYERLSSQMNGKSDAEWDSCRLQHFHAISRVCRAITAQAAARSGVFSKLGLPAEFVVGIFEDQDGPEMYEWLLGQSIDPTHVAKLGLSK
jgi:hypothetical protein